MNGARFNLRTQKKTTTTTESYYFLAHFFCFVAFKFSRMDAPSFCFFFYRRLIIFFLFSKISIFHFVYFFFLIIFILNKRFSVVEVKFPYKYTICCTCIVHLHFFYRIFFFLCFHLLFTHK